MNTAACLNSTDFKWFDTTEAAIQRRQERLIEEGVIRPSLSVSQARDLLARFHGVTSRSRQTRFRERLRRFEDFFLAKLPNCSQAEKDLARARLTGLIELKDVPNGRPRFHYPHQN